MLALKCVAVCEPSVSELTQRLVAYTKP